MTNEQGTSTELVPKAWQPDELTLMTGTLADIEASVLDYRRYMETHEVTDKDSCAEMKEKIVSLKGLQKDAEVAAHPVKSVIKKCSDWVQTKFNKASNAAEAAIGIGNGKVGTWEQAEERRTALEKKQEQERVNKQRIAEAEAQKKKDAEAAAERKKTEIEFAKRQLKDKQITKREYEKLLRVAGAQEEADLALAEADAEEHVATTPEVKVESKKTHVAGSIGRKNYSAKCLDRRVFVLEFLKRLQSGGTSEILHIERADGKADEIEIDWWDYISVSDEALGKTAREVKNVEVMEATFPGIKAEEKRTY